MPKTYNEIYIETRKALRDEGVEAFSLEARLIVAYAAGKTPEKLLQDLRLYTSDEVEEKSRELTRRRLSCEPVAYLTGSWEFYGIPLTITPDVLIPRCDTEVLVDVALGLVNGRVNDARILDLCTGSGCIACAMAKKMPASRVVLADISPSALKVAKKNIEDCKLSARALCVEADALGAPPIRLGSFDLIVCNPPYIASGEIAELDSSVKDYEPHGALDGGEDGLEFYRAVLSKWKNLLRPSGWLVFEVGEAQADSVIRLMRLSGMHGVDSAADTAGIARVVFGRN